MFETKNEEQLLQMGELIGQTAKSGDVIVLTGDLGAGKTTLTKGIGEGLGVSQMIKSPTYTIVREYEGRIPLYHLDVYRLGEDSDSIDLDDFIYGEGLVVIEWGHLLGSALPDDYLEIVIEVMPEGRQLSLIPTGLKSQRLKEAISHG